MADEVDAQQLDLRRQERNAIELSRLSPNQRMDGDGNPANLFELLKGDPNAQGYELKKVYSLKLVHGLMGYFPAAISAHKRIVLCLDRLLLIEVWKGLSPRASEMDSSIYYVNTQKWIGYASSGSPLEQELTKPEKILTRSEYVDLQAKNPRAIAWASGLIGGPDIDPADFPSYVDKMANECR